MKKHRFLMTSKHYIHPMTLTGSRLIIVLILPLLLIVACATSPLGRSQLAFFPENQLQEMGELSFANLKKEQEVVTDTAINTYVTCVADHIVKVLGDSQQQWEVTVFDADQANAFALPGSKIGVYKGLLDVAVTQGQLAAVIGHEVAHVKADHGNERISTNYAAEAGLSLINAALNNDPQAQRRVMGLLGVGVQVGVLLPYSRAQENEADLLGLDYMARAGFDPRQATDLWQNMSKAGGSKPPEFLSTHPASENRIESLQKRMPHAMELYREAQAQGRNPHCSRP